MKALWIAGRLDGWATGRLIVELLHAWDQGACRIEVVSWGGDEYLAEQLERLCVRWHRLPAGEHLHVSHRLSWLRTLYRSRADLWHVWTPSELAWCRWPHRTPCLVEPILPASLRRLGPVAAGPLPARDQVHSSDESMWTIGVCSQLTSRCRVEDLIWSLDLLLKNHAEARLIICGDGPARERLQAFTVHTQTNHAVQWVTDARRWPAILPHLKCFWLSGDEPECCRLLNDVLAKPLPVIACRSDWSESWIQGDRSDWLVCRGRAGRAERARITRGWIMSPAAWDQAVALAGGAAATGNHASSCADRAQAYLRIYQQMLHARQAAG